MKLFDRIYREHRKKLFSYLMRMCGDFELSRDIMQESFARFYKHYRNNASEAPLLYTIARNALFDHFRKEKHHNAFDEINTQSPLDSERHVMVREEYRQTLAAMEKLNREERDILSLVISSDMSYRDIARITELSESNVKVKVHRARLHLRQLIEELNHEG